MFNQPRCHLRSNQLVRIPARLNVWALLLSAIIAMGSSMTFTAPAAAVPVAPVITGLDAQPRNGGKVTIAVSFLAGSGEAFTIANYQYSTNGGTNWQNRDDAGKNTNATTTPLLITNTSVSGNTPLSNATSYTICIRATSGGANPSSTGTSSTCITSITGAPNEPTGLAITPSSQQLSVAFTAPTSNGGSAITGYQYSTDGGSTWRARTDAGTTGSPIVITKLSSDGTTLLTNGTPYAIQLRATNGTAGVPSSTVYGTPVGVPGSPASISAVPSNGQASVSWTAPTNNGGSAITGYIVEYSSDYGASWSTASSSVAATTTSYTVTALVNGTAYTFRVSAKNAYGTGSPTTTSSTLVAGTASAPTITSISPGNTQLSVAFSAPTDNGGSAITNYEYSIDGGNTWSVRSPVATTSPLVITGLPNDVPDTVTIRAVNGVGSGTASNQVVATPSSGTTVPGAPTITAITPSSTQLSVAFAAGSDGGETITNYEYSINGGAWTARSPTSTSSPIVLTSLTNGTTYAITIRAVNVKGSGATSNSVSAVPAAVPGAPTSVSGTSGSHSVLLSWTAPASNGGSAITGYKIEASTNGGGSWTTEVPSTGLTTTSYNVTGLTDGSAYIFRVSAINVIGASTPSTSSASVTPASPPGPPTIGSITPSSGKLTVAFTAPSDNGGASILTYYYSTDTGTTWFMRTDTGTTGSPIPISFLSSDGTTALANGTTYTVMIRAFNSVGLGELSNQVSAAPNSGIVAPTAPTAVSGTAGNTQVVLTWTAPASNGGATITRYTATSTPGSKTCTSTGSPPSTTCTVTGLTNGQAYTFVVNAFNGTDTSTNSTASASVTPATVPDSPTAVSAVGGNQQATVSWTASASNGGSAVTSYTATASNGLTCTTGSTSCTITGLSNGTAYTFTVVATNAIGNSVSSSASSSVTPAAAVPGAPTSVTASAGAAEATVSWTAPASNGGAIITSYTATSSPGGFTCSTSGTSCTVTSLTNGTAYTFTVRATNSSGPSDTSTASSAVTPADVPDAPSSVAGNPDNSQASVSWNVPSNNGSSITGYTVTATSGSDTVTQSCAASPCTITGLTNGNTYTVTVRATNGRGNSNSSSPASVKPRTVPGAPTIGTATAGNGQATVSWTAGSDGGATIETYTVTASPGGQTCTSSGTSCTVSGLSNGTTYTFSVKATNAAGQGSASSNASTKPRTVPGAPTIGSATAYNETATVSWTAPSDDGGDSVTVYTVTSNDGKTCTANAPATSCTVLGLTNGTSYTFSVKATNGAGQGNASSATGSVKPKTIPGAPTIGVASAGNAQVVVSWTAPDSDGGDTIETYTVTSTPGDFTCTTSGNSCTVTGLSNGTAYTFSVKATNSAGHGPASAASNSASPTATLHLLTFETQTAGGAVSIASQNVGDGSDASEVVAQPDTGYTFVKWTNASSTEETTTATLRIKNVNAAQTWRASFTRAAYALSFAAGTGGSIDTTTASVLYDDDGPTVTATPTTGYHFVKWSSDAGPSDDTTTAVLPVKNVRAAKTWTASFAKDQFALSFAAGTGGSVDSSTATVDYDDDSPDVTATAATGYHFVKWSNGTAADDTTTATLKVKNVRAAKTWTASFAKDQYTITFDPNGGSISGSDTATAEYLDDVLSSGFSGRPTPSRGGFTFLGWAETSGASDTATTHSAVAAKTFYAVWRATGAGKYTLTLNANGGSVDNASTEQDADTDVDPTEPTRSGYSFQGWDTATAGTTVVKARGAKVRMSSNVSLYAVWSRNVPGRPGGVNTNAGNGSVTVSWNAVSNSDTYTVVADPGGASCTVTAPATSCVISGLSNGVRYTFTVTAVNSAGNSLTTTATATPVAPGRGSSTERDPRPTPPTVTPTDPTPPGVKPLTALPIPAAEARTKGQPVVQFADVPTLVTATPIAQNKGLEVATSSNMRVQVETTRPGSGARPTTQGNVEVFVTRGEEAKASGSGFAPDSEVRAYLFSDPILLATFKTDAQGAFSGNLNIPADIVIGGHTIQINGYGPTQEILSTSIAVQIEHLLVQRSIKQLAVFKTGSKVVKAKTKAQITAIAKALLAGSNVKITLTGFATKAASAKTRALSIARTKAIAAQLRALGVRQGLVVRGVAPSKASAASRAGVLITGVYTATT